MLSISSFCFTYFLLTIISIPYLSLLSRFCLLHSSRLLLYSSCRAVTYTNRNTPLMIYQTNLPVQFQNGNYTIEPNKILVKVKLAALKPVDLFVRSVALPYIFRGPKGFGSDYSDDIVAIGPKAKIKTTLSVGDAECESITRHLAWELWLSITCGSIRAVWCEHW